MQIDPVTPISVDCSRKVLKTQKIVIRNYTHRNHTTSLSLLPVTLFFNDDHHSVNITSNQTPKNNKFPSKPILSPSNDRFGRSVSINNGQLEPFSVGIFLRQACLTLFRKFWFQKRVKKNVNGKVCTISKGKRQREPLTHMANSVAQTKPRPNQQLRPLFSPHNEQKRIPTTKQNIRIKRDGKVKGYREQAILQKLYIYQEMF